MEARDGAEGYCRIYRFTTGAAYAGQYYWTANRSMALGSGFRPTARDAARAAERCLLGEEEGENDESP